jgi:hypothetical protein
VYTRVSGVATWVQETICKLTDDAGSLAFPCPDFVCPADAVVLGLSNLKVPSALDSGAQSYNGFVPVSVTQTPTAGSALRYGRDTFVKVTAVDAGGASVACRWKVTVPEEDVLGVAGVLLSKGSGGSRTAMVLDGTGPGVVRVFAGLVYAGSLAGGAVARARLRSGRNVTSPYLTLQGGGNEESLLKLKPRVPFTYRSNLRVLHAARDVPRPTILVYFIYGQQRDLDAV